jgi:hypothetical protein
MKNFGARRGADAGPHRRVEGFRHHSPPSRFTTRPGRSICVRIASTIGASTATSPYGCEYLLTWNCRHIANAELHRAIRRVVEQYGYELPSLCTPEELMGEEQ